MLVTIVVDLILTAIVALGVFIGYKKGFLMVLSKPIKLFLSIFLAISFCSVVASSLVQPIIEEPVTERVTAYLSDNAEEVFEDGEIPTLIKFVADLSGIDLGADSTDESINLIVSKLALPIVHSVSLIIAFLLVYFLSRLILWPAFIIINKVISAGFIGTLNKILGCVSGFLAAIIACWLLVCLFGFFIGLPFMAENDWVINFNGGLVYGFFESFSPIALLLSF